MSDEEAVLAANLAFYEAFRARDAGWMARLWARERRVACIHPGLAALVGRDAVMSSWRAILGQPDAPAVECVDAEASLLGDAAFVTCIERAEGAELVATNVFAREGDAWRLVLHQAGPLNRRLATDLGELN